MNANKFSPCSISNISVIYKSHGSCLQVPSPCVGSGPSLFYLNIDPMLTNLPPKDDCCSGAALLPSTYQCRPADFFYPCQGECWGISRYYLHTWLSDYVSSPLPICLHTYLGPAYCTGSDPYCPGNVIFPDGTFCDTNTTAQGHQGQCLGAQCLHPNTQFCDDNVSPVNP